ncbi:MAG: hypothetical protein MK137_09865 [Rickettsiales bacterium]|nr:hypothetical protein [Rickettsiales bacterium]
MRIPLFFASLVLLQIMFWNGISLPFKGADGWQGTRHIQPSLGILNAPHSKTMANIVSFGDPQLYFRIRALLLQNAGDTYGRFTSLKKYNYEYLKGWAFLMDELDHRSHYMPSLMSYIFGQTPQTEDVIHVIEYLDHHASRDLQTKWWWMYQAVYLANSKLKDDELALSLAYKLASSDAETMPIWGKQLAAFIHEDRGEKEQARRFMQSIIDNLEDIPEKELNFMQYFIQERLELIKESSVKE